MQANQPQQNGNQQSSQDNTTALLQSLSVLTLDPARDKTTALLEGLSTMRISEPRDTLRQITARFLHQLHSQKREIEFGANIKNIAFLYSHTLEPWFSQGFSQELQMTLAEVFKMPLENFKLVLRWRANQRAFSAFNVACPFTFEPPTLVVGNEEEQALLDLAVAVEAYVRWIKGWGAPELATMEFEVVQMFVEDILKACRALAEGFGIEGW